MNKRHASRCNSRLCTCSLLLMLLSVLLACTEVQPVQVTDSGVAYLVPVDESQIESRFTPAQLNATGIVQVDAASSWESIQTRVDRNELRAIIIHHAAIDRVDSEQLARLVRHRKLVVTGIGLSSDQLGKLIRMPELRLWDQGITFTTTEYFYTYSYDPHGSRITSDSIADEQGVARMLTIILEHLNTGHNSTTTVSANRDE